MTDKPFFRERTLAQIKQLDLALASDRLVDRILSLEADQGLIITRQLIPEEYHHDPQVTPDRKFLKHGKEIKLPRSKSISQAVQQRKTPLQKRQKAFDRVQVSYCTKGELPFYCCFSIAPPFSNDKRKRKIPLVECVKGAMIYTYSENSHEPDEKIFIMPYDDAQRVKRDGVQILVKVPSRTEGKERNSFVFKMVPVVDVPRKFALAEAVWSDHVCESKRFKIGYTYPDSSEGSLPFYFCAHEIAAYLAICDHYFIKQKNVVPLQMNPFAFPTQLTATYFNRLNNNCLIFDPRDDSGLNHLAHSVLPNLDQTVSQEKFLKFFNPGFRKLNQAEEEILFWALIAKKGHDPTFFAVEKIRDYDWGY